MIARKMFNHADNSRHTLPTCTGGASIIPSARPSIHSHERCPFAYAEAMGRFGMLQEDNYPSSEHRASSSKQRANRSNDCSTDEVDNVFSKPINAIRPSSYTQLNNSNNRRNSLEKDVHYTQDCNILSKSLPATLPSHSYCSDVSDDDDESLLRHENLYSDTSYHSSQATPRSIIRTPVNRTPVNTSNLNHSSSKVNTKRTKANQAQGSLNVLPLLVLIAAVVVSVILYNKTDVMLSNNVYDESRFYDDIDILGNKYRIDENALLRMQTGIATIFERQDSGSFMFVYNSNESNYNLKQFNKFINDVSVTASKYLRNESTPVHYTMVEGSALDMKGHGELISRFREDLHRTGVMLVKHVEAIPSALAMAFHYYCDEYNPLVRKSAIFFTLNLAKCSAATDKKLTHAVIEKCLAQKWSGVPADSIGPLLTRVVSVVIDLTSAF